MHVSQLAGNNLHVMSGLRRQPTCWAAPWRSSPLPSSSTRPRAPCPEPALFARLLTKMARQMQVLHATFTTIFFTLYSSQYPPFSLPFFFLSLSFYLHMQTHMLLLITQGENARERKSKAYLGNEYHSFTMAIDR